MMTSLSTAQAASAQQVSPGKQSGQSDSRALPHLSSAATAGALVYSAAAIPIARKLRSSEVNDIKGGTFVGTHQQLKKVRRQLKPGDQVEFYTEDAEYGSMMQGTYTPSYTRVKAKSLMRVGDRAIENGEELRNLTRIPCSRLRTAAVLEGTAIVAGLAAVSSIVVATFNSVQSSSQVNASRISTFQSKSLRDDKLSGGHSAPITAVNSTANGI